MHCYVFVLPGSIENRYNGFFYTFTLKVLEKCGDIQLTLKDKELDFL